MFIRIFLALLLMTSQAWATVAWRNGTGANTVLGTSNASDIDTNTFNNIVSPLDSLLANYRKGMGLVYDSAAQITVAAGEATVSNSDGSIRLMLKNPTNTTVTWADIDTGAEASGTTYYIYAIAASASSTSATFKISASSTSPSGVTYYKRIGSFYNNASSDIDRSKIYDEPYGNVKADANGASVIQTIYDYGTSASSFTERRGGIVAMGTISVANKSSTAITNLPYTSATSYHCTANQVAGTLALMVGPAAIANQSGSSTLIENAADTTFNIEWVCVGY